MKNVEEYIDEILENILNDEKNSEIEISNSYFKFQTDINNKMRAILIDWLIDVHLKYKLVPQTMYIAVNLIDRYLENNDVDNYLVIDRNTDLLNEKVKSMRKRK